MNLNLKNKKNKKGFAMLFAVLTAGLLVTIGMSIFNISLKELLVSTSIRDSQTAYYASQSAYECFKYWQLFDDSGAFSPFIYNDTTGTTSLKNGNTTTNIECNGISSPIILTDQGNGVYKYTSGNGVFFKYSSTTNSTEPEAGFTFVVKGLEDHTCPTESAICLNNYGTISTSTFSGYNTSQSGRRVERKYEIIEANI